MFLPRIHVKLAGGVGRQQYGAELGPVFFFVLTLPETLLRESKTVQWFRGCTVTSTIPGIEWTTFIINFAVENLQMTVSIRE